jgi:hypothetical protein
VFKKSIAILLGVLVIAQCMVNLGLYTYFTVNRQAIADKLCVNKSNPQMHCNGHCFLAKQLNKAEKNEKQQSQILKEKDENVISDEHEVLAPYLPVYKVSQIYPQRIFYSSTQYHLDIVKPPAA